ncbi:AAA family ATPase [Clostridium sp. LY3-2]|uniref:AAA family ATPase n=1 Tax=Clostridium sp. LY3-2 TaxID=2942482 RepID=UPI002152BFC8|nr:AAA family ATPase [Clostridium sp. LY3-2]MCR6513520.1 AAA family ATPase [Clostridium sp. LY3-2]
MRKELTPKEVIFNLEISESEGVKKLKDIDEIKNNYKKIKRALNIKKEGYNLYLMDTFSKEKVDELVLFIEEEYKSLEPPSDICYVTLKEDKKPFPIFLTNGRGKELKEEIKNLKEEYLIKAIEFYNTSSNEEKDTIVDDIHSKRNTYISELMEVAKKEGFDVKATSGGFAFIPLDNGEVMTEKEYDDLPVDEKDIILNKASGLKEIAEDILEKLKNIEVNSLDKLKEIFKEYITEEMREYKEDVLLEFIVDDDVYNYLEKLFINIEDELLDNYNIDLEDESTLTEIVSKYDIEVIVDNTNFKNPRVIYEDDPSLMNLLGNIEYESQNGNYITDLSLISSGSLLEANGGCLIIRLNSLISNINSYYYLKKTLLSGKLNFDSNRNYLELLSINGLKPEEIPIDVKVILIGDYESYNILYNNDEDFKKIFGMKCDMTRTLKGVKSKLDIICDFIKERGEKNSLRTISNDAIKSIIRSLTRSSGNREEINLEEYDIDKILIEADEIAEENEKEIILKEHVDEIIYEKENIEKAYIDMYKDKKMKIVLEGKRVGNINGLAVLDTGLSQFGKPLRITCLALRGNGNIIDVHRESKLSGRIHEKSINILSGILKSLVSKYETLPINLHVSFEQSYGIIDGDSASVAEMIVMLSSITGKPIKQNIAVTGSLNQFKEVQAIGGVNEKIEGFFNICKELNTINDKGVLIPSENVDELILNDEIENAVERGYFHIYKMDTLDDAIETLLLEEGESLESFFELFKEEIDKFKVD